MSMDAVHGFGVTYTSNTVVSNLLLKLEVVLLLEISGLREFQCVSCNCPWNETVLEHVRLYCWGK